MSYHFGNEKDDRDADKFAGHSSDGPQRLQQDFHNDRIDRGRGSGGDGNGGGSGGNSGSRVGCIIMSIVTVVFILIGVFWNWVWRAGTFLWIMLLVLSLYAYTPT